MSIRQGRCSSTTKQTIPGRVAQPSKANVNDVLDQAEARGTSNQELADPSLDAPFEQLESLGDTAETEARPSAPKSA
ncbi:hypothetical protein ACIBBB_17230 [Streptomyces sp. NPDC051217]|uniref:hypothetical protein n=1 Tax=Streptomyces sp. NPDC051217 TaxID=3365644 RepID=UPI00379C1BD7